MTVEIKRGFKYYALTRTKLCGYYRQTRLDIKLEINTFWERLCNFHQNKSYTFHINEFWWKIILSRFKIQCLQCYNFLTFKNNSLKSNSLKLPDTYPRGVFRTQLISNMELFAKIFKVFYLFTFAKRPIFWHVWLDS